VPLADALFATAARLPDKTALVDGKRRLSYGELAGAVDRFASALQARGVAAGDRVAVYLGNVAEAAIAMYGILRAGAVFMPVNPLARAGKVTALLTDAGAVALVTNAALAGVWTAAVAGAPPVRFVVTCGGPPPAASPAGAPGVPTPGWDDFLAEGAASAPAPAPTDDGALAALIYTSGSTGEAKGVMLSHRNMLTVAASVTEYLGITDSDVLYCALPLSFSYGICQLTTGLPQGATIVLDASFAFPAKSLATIAAEGVTCLAGVPTMYAVLAGMSNLSDFDLSALRILTNAADALPEPVLAAVRRALPRARFFSMYGLTECQRVTYLPPEDLDSRAGSVGRGMARQEVWLVDEDGRRLPPGSTGELVVTGEHVMRGYWNRPRETAERLRPGPRGETVLHTGDIFRTDADGYLYFVARKDDVIKTRGEKVSPREVENAIYVLAGVAGAAVVGVPDPVLGHAIKAFVVRRPDVTITDRDVVRHCRERLESYMVPHTVEFVDELPTTASGKVKRAALREPGA
jgi:amino acid adenylation domain-containing protein